MRKQLGIFTIMALGAVSLYAQEGSGPVKLGLKAGIPVTDMFSASNTTLFGNSNQIPGSNFTSAVPRYELGVSAEFRLPYHLRFEVDGLFKRGGFGSYAPFGAGQVSADNHTTFDSWEIPGLFKYNFAMGHFRPFVDFGASLRHLSTVAQTTFTNVPYETWDNNSLALHNRNSVGGIAGFGMTFKEKWFELTPEARYTRWANESFEANGLHTNLDQGDVLLGITF